MKTIVDDTIDILSTMNLQAKPVSTPPGFTGIQIELPNEAQAFFVWSKLDSQDYCFRIARFWESENPFSMWSCQSLIDALAKTRVMAKQ